MTDVGRIERQAVVWPVGKPVGESYYSAVRFNITPGVGNIASKGALGDMTAEVTRSTPGMTTATAEVTHDSIEATAGIIYFGYQPDKGDTSLKTLKEMQPTLEYALRMVSPAGGLKLTYLETDPVVALQEQR